MKNRSVVLTVFLLLVVFATFIIRRWNEPQPKEAFDRHPGNLIYTKHARCRMACRHIDEGEIQEIMVKGLINFSKSKRNDQPCPTFALQGRTTSGENLRVIFAQCTNETKVVTCYNLEEEVECYCPGDERKGQPKNRN